MLLRDATEVRFVVLRFVLPLLRETALRFGVLYDRFVLLLRVTVLRFCGLDRFTDVFRFTVARELFTSRFTLLLAGLRTVLDFRVTVRSGLVITDRFFTVERLPSVLRFTTVLLLLPASALRPTLFRVLLRVLVVPRL